MGLWSVAGFRSDLMSSTIFDSECDLSFLSLGTRNCNTALLGLTVATAMDWAFSTGRVLAELTHLIFSFSANGTAGDVPGVPDGGATVMFLGGALGALGMARRFQKRKTVKHEKLVGILTLGRISLRNVDG